MSVFLLYHRIEAKLKKRFLHKERDQSRTPDQFPDMALDGKLKTTFNSAILTELWEQLTCDYHDIANNSKLLSSARYTLKKTDSSIIKQACHVFWSISWLKSSAILRYVKSFYPRVL